MFTKCSIYFDSHLGDLGGIHACEISKKTQVKKSSTHPSVQLAKLHIYIYTYLHIEEYIKYTSVEQMVYVCIYIYLYPIYTQKYRKCFLCSF